MSEQKKRRLVMYADEIKVITEIARKMMIEDETIWANTPNRLRYGPALVTWLARRTRDRREE
jgi:hypothetical protein